MANLLEELKKRLEADSFVVEVDEEDGYSISLTLEGMGEDETGVVLLDVAPVIIDAQVNDYEYYRFFTMFTASLENADMNKLLSNLAKLNDDALLGHYGVVEDEEFLYHRYVTKVAAGDVPAAVDYLYSTLVDVLAIVDHDYNAATGA